MGSPGRPPAVTKPDRAEAVPADDAEGKQQSNIKLCFFYTVLHGASLKGHSTPLSLVPSVPSYRLSGSRYWLVFFHPAVLCFRLSEAWGSHAQRRWKRRKRRNWTESEDGQKDAAEKMKSFLWWRMRWGPIYWTLCLSVWPWLFSLFWTVNFRPPFFLILCQSEESGSCFSVIKIKCCLTVDFNDVTFTV